MPIAIGDTLPDANLLRMGTDGPETVQLNTLIEDADVVLFGLPGPFTGTCSTSHLPSFMRTKAALEEAGVDHVICFAVCDPFVMGAWAEQTGAAETGLHMLADSSGDLTRALGLAFDAPAVGLHGRTVRHSMYAVDGVVKILHFEEAPGVCEATAGEAMLESIRSSAG